MDCPFVLPVKAVRGCVQESLSEELCYSIEDSILVIAQFMTKEQADYIVQAINSHEKLVRVIEETNQCFKCKYGYRQSILTCPGEADAELPCAGFEEEHEGLNYLEQVLKEAEKLK